MLWIGFGHARGMFGMCLGMRAACFGTCLEHVLDMSWAWVGHVYDMH